MQWVQMWMSYCSVSLKFSALLNAEVLKMSVWATYAVWGSDFILVKITALRLPVGQDMCH